MKKYQLYFFVLKAVVLAQIVFLAAGFEIAKSPMFAFVDGLFKLSLGLFLGFYFWLTPPKGIDWEDSIIISIGGFLILTEIRFAPLIKLYETRDWTISQLVSVKNGQESSNENTPQ
jgi:hypothetical protein